MSISKEELRKRRGRLVVLADHLEQTVKPVLNGCKFDMGYWGAANKADINKKDFDMAEAHECGYTACALGWAIVSPELIKAGIRRVATASSCRCEWCREMKVNKTNFDFDHDKTCKFFGIDDDEFNELFLGPGRGVRGIDSVANKLRKVAAKEV